MHNIFVLLFSIFIFFTLFLMVEKIYDQKREGLNAQASAPAKLVTSSKFVNYQSNLVDSQYLEKKLASVSEIKNNLANLRGKLYKKGLTELLTIKCNQKTTESKNAQKFDVTIDNSNNFNNIITIDIPVGVDGAEGLPGDKGIKGPQGNKGPMGDEGNCGAILS